MGCKTAEDDSVSETAMKPSENLAAQDDGQDRGPTCYDSELVRIKCHDGQVFSHAGCEGEEKMKRCASCSDIAATLCGPGTRFIHVPECPSSNQGDCAPVKD